MGWSNPHMHYAADCWFTAYRVWLISLLPIPVRSPPYRHGNPLCTVWHRVTPMCLATVRGIMLIPHLAPMRDEIFSTLRTCCFCSARDLKYHCNLQLYYFCNNHYNPGNTCYGSYIERDSDLEVRDSDLDLKVRDSDSKVGDSTTSLRIPDPYWCVRLYI
jgi:hypothetical protein